MMPQGVHPQANTLGGNGLAAQNQLLGQSNQNQWLMAA